MVQEGGVRGRSSGGDEVVIVLCFLNKHSLLVLVAASPWPLKERRRLIRKIHALIKKKPKIIRGRSDCNYFKLSCMSLTRRVAIDAKIYYSKLTVSLSFPLCESSTLEKSFVFAEEKLSY